MPPDLGLALLVSLLGMSLVFAAIVLLWGVMALLVRLTAQAAPIVDPAVAGQEPGLAGAGEQRARLARRAAAAAVGVALAQQAPSWPRAEPGVSAPAMSAWQVAMRASQLRQRGTAR